MKTFRFGILKRVINYNNISKPEFGKYKLTSPNWEFLKKNLLNFCRNSYINKNEIDDYKKFNIKNIEKISFRNNNRNIICSRFNFSIKHKPYQNKVTDEEDKLNVAEKPKSFYKKLKETIKKYGKVGLFLYLTLYGTGIIIAYFLIINNFIDSN